MIRAMTIISMLIFSAASVAVAQEDQTPNNRTSVIELLKPVQCYPTNMLEKDLMEKYYELPFIKFIDARFKTIVSITINPDKGTLTVYESHPEDPSLSCVLSEGVQAKVLTTVLEFIIRNLNKGTST